MEFSELVELRRSQGFEEHAIELDGVKVDGALFRDTVWPAIRHIADAVVYLHFEETKAYSRGSRAEGRKLKSLALSLGQVGSELFSYRASREKGSE